MNKKGLALQKLISIALITTVGLILLYAFFGPGQLGAKIIKLTPKVNVTVGGEIEPTKVEIPADINTVFENLTKAFEEGMKSENTYCLIPYQAIEIKDSFKNYYIFLEAAPDGMWLIVKDKEVGTELKKAKINGLGWPCVVGGKAEYQGKEYVAAENFYNNWIKTYEHPELWLTSLKRPDIVTYSWLKIVGNEKIETKLEEGKKTFSLDDKNLEYSDFPEYDQEKLLEFKDKKINLLYKVEENICFIATYSGLGTLPGCDAGEKGIDDDCLKDTITYKSELLGYEEEVKMIKLPFCSEKTEGYLCKINEKYECVDDKTKCTGEILKTYEYPFEIWKFVMECPKEAEQKNKGEEITVYGYLCEVGPKFDCVTQKELCTKEPQKQYYSYEDFRNNCLADLRFKT